MLVCHCAAVNDRTVRAAIADGATDLVALADACGAGGFCGGCQPTLVALLTAAGVAQPTAAERTAPGEGRRAALRSVVRAIEEDVLAAGWLEDQPVGDAAGLARRYSCTRATLRRAVWVLEQHGVVRADPGDGAVRVARPTATAVAEAAALHLWSAGTRTDQLVGARRSLEGAMARAAAAARAPAGVRRLRHWVQDAEQTMDPRDAALEFHLAIADTAANPAFEVLAHSLIEVTRLHRGLAPRRDAHDTAASLAEHRTIAAAVLDGDEHAAEEASRVHLDAFYARSRPGPVEHRPGADGPGADGPVGDSLGEPASASVLARALAWDVHRRRLRPGELLGTQQQLRHRFGVSDGTLRQAATLLEYYAVAHLRVGGEEGVVVSSPDPWPTAELLALHLQHAGIDSRQLFVARRPLELTAAAAAAEAITAAGTAQLRARLEEERHARGQERAVEPGAVPHDVHLTLAQASGDPVVRLFVDALKLVAVRAATGGVMRSAAGAATTGEAWDERLLADHEALVDAVCRRDAAGAVARMSDHLDWLAAVAEVAEVDGAG